MLHKSSNSSVCVCENEEDLLECKLTHIKQDPKKKFIRKVANEKKIVFHICPNKNLLTQTNVLHSEKANP